MTLFSNEARAFPGNNELGDDPVGGMKEKPWLRFRLPTVRREAKGIRHGFWRSRLLEISGEKCAAGELANVLKR